MIFIDDRKKLKTSALIVNDTLETNGWSKFQAPRQA